MDALHPPAAPVVVERAQLERVRRLLLVYSRERVTAAWMLDMLL